MFLMGTLFCVPNLSLTEGFHYTVKTEIVMRGASPHYSVKITLKFVISTRTLVILM